MALGVQESDEKLRRHDLPATPDITRLDKGKGKAKDF